MTFTSISIAILMPNNNNNNTMIIIFTIIIERSLAQAGPHHIPCDYTKWNTKLLPTEWEGCTGEYWPEVVAVQTKFHLL